MHRSLRSATQGKADSKMWTALLLIAFVAGTHGLSGDVTAEDVNPIVEDANAYVDSVIEFELPRRMGILDPLTRRNFQPINGNHLYVSVRFVTINMTGFRQIRRDGDCQVTRVVDERRTTVRCDLLTDLDYLVVVNATATHKNIERRNVKVNGTFHAVKGPLTVTFERSLPVKVEFSPRYDGMANSVAQKYPRPMWYEFLEHEFYFTMIQLFEYATQKVFATEMLRAVKDIPFPE
ncbi:uncharacterized protein LOC144093773 [Amblyomma americanum]